MFTLMRPGGLRARWKIHHTPPPDGKSFGIFRSYKLRIGTNCVQL